MAAPSPVRVGDPAPAFSVPAVHGDAPITLDDYRGRQALFLGLYRGLHCPFCRRHLAQLDVVRRQLEAIGVATVAVVNTPLDRARLYFRNATTGVRLGVDPDAAIHRAYAVPAIEFVEAAARTEAWPRQITLDEFMAARVDPTGELPAPVSPLESNDALNALDGFRTTPADDAIRARHGTQLVGQFLIDRAGIVRWRFVEAERTPLDIGRLPTPREIVEAAARLAPRSV